jgi:hypothetical protein
MKKEDHLMSAVRLLLAITVLVTTGVIGTLVQAGSAGATDYDPALSEDGAGPGTCGDGIDNGNDGPKDATEFIECYRDIIPPPSDVVSIGGQAGLLEDGGDASSEGSASGGGGPRAPMVIATAIVVLVAAGWYAQKRWLQ